MLLAVDIGNTNSTFGIFDREKLLSKFRIKTAQILTSEIETNFFIEEFSKTKVTKENIREVYVSSVVGEAREAMRAFARESFNCEPFFVTAELKLGLEIKYNSPKTLGSDRFVDAFAAANKYGIPCIVCDFGTATTIDAVNSQREFLGGTITPGITTLANSLHKGTSKLPQVEVVMRESVIGDSTEHSIQSGIYFGYIGLVEKIISRMIEELNEKPRIIATGGFGKVMTEATKSIDIFDENLLLDGLRLISERQIDQFELAVF